jgi:hypothetical protein
MIAPKILKAVLDIDAARVLFMVAEDNARTLTPIRASIKAVDGNPDMTAVAGPAHDVMRVIGLLADHGEACLSSVMTPERVEEFDAAAAYVELYTGNGARTRPAPWAVDGEGQFLAEIIAKRARDGLFGFMP